MTMAVKARKVLVVFVLGDESILLHWIQRALRTSFYSAVAMKVSLRIQFDEFMLFVTLQRTGKTDAYKNAGKNTS